MYYYCECDVEGVLKCDMHLHITEHLINTEFRVRCIPTIGTELSDMSDCSTSGSHGHLLGVWSKSQQHSCKVFPVLDQTSLIWHKKIKAMEKAKPQALEYTLMTTAKYLHALDILYENQEVELKINNTKLKEVEAKVQALKIEQLMLNSQLSTMRKEKGQCKQELQKALERPKARKTRRRAH